MSIGIFLFNFSQKNDSMCSWRCQSVQTTPLYKSIKNCTRPMLGFFAIALISTPRIVARFGILRLSVSSSLWRNRSNTPAAESPSIFSATLTILLHWVDLRSFDISSEYVAPNCTPRPLWMNSSDGANWTVTSLQTVHPRRSSWTPSSERLNSQITCGKMLLHA